MKSDYAALIRETIAYLKESSLPVFATKEEWKALHTLKNPPPQLSPNQPTPAPLFRPHPALDKKPLSTKEPVIEKKQPPSQGQPPKKKEDSKIPINDLGVKNFLQRYSVPLAACIPDDAQAVRAMTAYKEYIGNVDVVIFASDADTDTLALIKNLSKSIDQKLAPVKVLRSDRLERDQRWDLFIAKNPVKLYIASSGFSQLKNAMHYYTHPEGLAHGLFNGVPLIILSPCASYMQFPKEKSILWNQICTLLKR